MNLSFHLGVSYSRLSFIDHTLSYQHSTLEQRQGQVKH